MNKKARKRHRDDIAHELICAAAILEEEGICPDVGPIRSAANMCNKCGGDIWEYELTNVIFRLGQSARSFPPALADLSCRVNARVAGACSVTHYLDPLTEASIGLVFEAFSSTDRKKYVQSWHFDRHISDNGSNSPVTVHPRYHFQFGGNSMEAYADELGVSCFESVLLLDSPRISHPPLDGILLVDFLLSNFLGEKWNTLRNNPRYTSIVQASQRRNWKPFASALNSHWITPSPQEGWPPKDVWPNLC